MAKTLGGMIRFFSAWSCLDCFQRGFCDITSIKCNSVTSKIFQKCLIIVPKVWEVTHNVFHHPWHIYQMDFYYFFSSTKDFTFDFSMSHCYTRYRSEEISPNSRNNVEVCVHLYVHLHLSHAHFLIRLLWTRMCNAHFVHKTSIIWEVSPRVGLSINSSDKVGPG